MLIAKCVPTDTLKKFISLEENGLNENAHRRENIFKITLVKVRSFSEIKILQLTQNKKKKNMLTVILNRKEVTSKYYSRILCKGFCVGKVQTIKINQTPYFLNGLNFVL